MPMYYKRGPDWQQWQNGSTFFNGGYLDYLTDNNAKTDEQGGEQKEWQ